MAVVPAGRRRDMVAQAYHSSAAKIASRNHDFGLTEDQWDALVRFAQSAEAMPVPTGDLPVPDGNIPEPVDSDAAEPPIDAQPGETVADEPVHPVETDQGANMSKIVFKFLEGLGYPPRRLYEFKNQFYDERGSKDGETQVTVTLPDQIYGSDNPIPKDKLKQFIDVVEAKLGLSFVDYQRSNLRVTLNFSSASQEINEDELQGDVLDQVYGKPKNGKKNPRKKASAPSFREMIKSSKNDLVASLLAQLEKQQ